MTAADKVIKKIHQFRKSYEAGVFDERALKHLTVDLLSRENSFTVAEVVVTLLLK